MVHAHLLALLITGGAGLEPARQARRVERLDDGHKSASTSGTSNAKNHDSAPHESAVEVVSMVTDATGETERAASGAADAREQLSEHLQDKLDVVSVGLRTAPLSKAEAAQLYADPRRVSPRELTCFRNAVTVTALFFMGEPDQIKSLEITKAAQLTVDGDSVQYEGQPVTSQNTEVRFQTVGTLKDGPEGQQVKPVAWPTSAQSWNAKYSSEGPDQKLPLPGTKWREVAQRGRRATAEATKEGRVEISNPFIPEGGVGDAYSVEPDDILYPCSESGKPEDGLCRINVDELKEYECRDSDTVGAGAYTTSASLVMFVASLLVV